ncbi:MAG: tail fiber protein [Bacteroidales bacterium]|nr:tail fiber protein [Bacteroidales bacterium]
MKQFITVFIVLFSITAYSQITETGNKVGIGTENPIGKLQIRTDREPPSELQNPANGFLILENTLEGNASFTAGVDGSIGSWIQSRGFFAGNRAYNLLLNPKGGKIGIGTTNPIGKLQIRANREAPSELQNPANGFLILENASEGNTSFTAGVDGRIGSWIQSRSFSAGNSAYNLLLNPKGGNVGIGTTKPDQALTVKGKIHAEEIIVDLNIPHPDYVFSEDYKLKSLDEVETHIKTKGHLEGIPKSSDVKENGLNLGELNTKLLEKIEELTLYMIEMNKEMKSLKNENKLLQEKVNSLKTE